MEPKTKQFSLPYNIISPHDVTKLINELDDVDGFFLQMQARRSGENVTLPQMSATMENLLQKNNLNLLRPEDREKLKYILQTLRNKAPVIHMSFSADPDRVFMEKIIAWFRSEVHPMMLLQVGLQPNIGAGFTLRTPNRFFDFSLRQHLINKKDLLIKEMTDGVKI